MDSTALGLTKNRNDKAPDNGTINLNVTHDNGVPMWMNKDIDGKPIEDKYANLSFWLKD
jgi:hypothetical protein